MSRWQVETTPDEFQSVRADELVVASGCLVFFDHGSVTEEEDSRVDLAFAQGTWLTVHLDAEA